MPNPFDATLKDIARQHDADYVAGFHLSTQQPATHLNVDLSTVSAATDVAFGFGDPIREISDLNFQSGPDEFIVARVQFYGSAYHLRFHVPVRSLLILLRPAADRSDLDGKLAYAVADTQLQFQCEVVRMWKEPLARFLTGGVGLLPLAPLCQVPPGTVIADWLKQVVHEIDQRLVNEVPHAEAVRLMTATFILAGMRVDDQALDDIFQGVRIMHESSAFDLMEKKGALQQMHRVLLRLGQPKFGAADSTTESAVKGIKDVDRLERMVDAVGSVASWQELLATP